MDLTKKRIEVLESELVGADKCLTTESYEAMKARSRCFAERQTNQTVAAWASCAMQGILSAAGTGNLEYDFCARESMRHAEALAEACKLGEQYYLDNLLERMSEAAQSHHAHQALHSALKRRAEDQARQVDPASSSDVH